MKSLIIISSIAFMATTSSTIEKPSTQVDIEKGETRVHSCVTIKASATEVWQVLQYPGNIADFHPLVKKSETISNQLQGDSCERRCAFIPMGIAEETVTQWEAGQSFTTEISGGEKMPPLKYMRGHIELQPVDNETSIVCFTLTYKLKYGLIGRLMNALMVRKQFSKAPPQYVFGLKQYVETGKKPAPEILESL